MADAKAVKVGREEAESRKYRRDPFPVHSRVPTTLRMGILLFLLVLCVSSVTLNVFFFRRERYRAVLLTPEATPGCYSIETETSHPVLFAIQFKRQLYIVTEDSNTVPQSVTLFAPSVSGELSTPVAEGRKEITLSEFHKDFWFINRQLGGW